MKQLLTLLLICMILSQTLQKQNLKKEQGWQSYPGTSAGIKFWQLCTIAFCDAQSIENWNCGPTSEFSGFSDITVAQNIQFGTQAFIGYYPTDNTIYVSFRGSNNLPNWVLDLDFFKTVSPFCEDCLVHNGFYTAYKTIQSQIISAVQNLTQLHPTATVAITGTSLGAAEATICAADFMYQKIDFQYFMTFGSPRVGDKSFANWFDNTIEIQAYRVVHYKDIVPHYFPQSFGYQHINTEIWYTSDDNENFQICFQNEDPKCSDQFNLFECSNKDHTTYFNLDRELIINEHFQKIQSQQQNNSQNI